MGRLKLRWAYQDRKATGSAVYFPMQAAAAAYSQALEFRLRAQHVFKLWGSSYEQ